MTDFEAVLATWQPFFSAQLGAGAALLGLLFVGLSLNLARILAEASLPLRAEICLILLALQIVVCSIMLIPDQGRTAVGIESLLLAAVVWLVTTRLGLRVQRETITAERAKSRRNLAFLQLATLPYVAGSAMILLDAPGALNVVALGMIMCFLKVGLEAWVLAVEINR